MTDHDNAWYVTRARLGGLTTSATHDMDEMAKRARDGGRTE